MDDADPEGSQERPESLVLVRKYAKIHSWMQKKETRLASGPLVSAADFHLREPPTAAGSSVGANSRSAAAAPGCLGEPLGGVVFGGFGVGSGELGSGGSGFPGPRSNQSGVTLNCSA